MQFRPSLFLATLFTIATVALLSRLAIANPSDDQRPFNEDWLYHRGEYEDARFPETEDQHWRLLNLPHGTEISDPVSVAKTYTRNNETSWYRKRFDVPAHRKGQPVSIHFEGVTGEATVWINGHLLSKNGASEADFQSDITPFLRYGGEPNVIAIRLQTLGNERPEIRRLALGGHVWLQFKPAS